MRVSIDPNDVEELAWLVKDNLQTKHLILAAEELFVEFLGPQFEEGASLELESMLSYQRMLLHRLADCFGLVHESVGEGDDRHIVIQRCEESSIPLMLVSDVLESCYGEVHHSSSNRQLPLRTPTGEDGQIRQPSLQSTALSLEDREAAYQAARERIFSDPLLISEDTTEHKETQRVRPVPIVARRMIAHALGKPSVLAPNEMSTSSEKIIPEVLKEAPVHSSAKAARRMLTQALGFPVSNPSSRGAERQPAKKQIPLLANEAGCRQSVVNADVVSTEGLHHVERIEATELDNDRSPGESRGKDFESACLNEVDHRNIEATPRKTIRKDQPGAAARRIFAQALGLPQTVPCPQSVDDSRGNHNSTMAQLDSAGGKTISSVNLNNVQYFSEESTSNVDWLTRPVESTTGSFNRRRSTGSIQVIDHSKLEVVLQEEVRKGGGKGHKVENRRRLKKQVFQEDHETGELFLISNHKNTLKTSPQTKG